MAIVKPSKFPYTREVYEDLFPQSQQLGNETYSDRQGEYRGFPIISRDTRINGGVYFTRGSEIIKVDLGTDTVLQQFVNEFDRYIKLEECSKKISLNQLILMSVTKYVMDKIPYSKTDPLSKPVFEGRIIDLGIVIENKWSVCRHQNLVIATILEKYINEGVLRGKVSIDRNYNPKYGGHAWCRYTNSKGEVSILDASQGIECVPLKSLMRSSQPGVWDYARPEDSREWSTTKRIKSALHYLLSKPLVISKYL